MTSLPSGAKNISSAFDDDRFDGVAEFADRAISLWISIREASYHRELPTLETYCPQVRILTLAVFQTVRELGSRENARVE
jgi:hypothetical protein